MAYFFKTESKCKQTIMKRKIQVLAVLLVLSSSCLFGQNKNTGSARKSTAKSKMSSPMDDKQFAKEAAKSGMKEIEMGNDAKEKTGNERVKNFASMMVRDHSKVNEELRAISNKEKISLSAEDTTGDRTLQSKTGTAYDKQYMKIMVEDHSKAIKLFERESNEGKDAELKAYAYRMLPTLKMHLDSARAIQSSLK
jgi:putative membrane protein